MRNKPIPEVAPEDAEFVRSFLVHEDADVLVFNKPSGLASQDGANITRSLDSLLDTFAKSNGKRPRLVHRLDTQTSGLMIVAKTKPAAAMLSEEFAERRAQKKYLAIIAGDLGDGTTRSIDASLVKVREAGRPRMIVARPERPGALSAMTKLRVLARSAETSLVELSPKTGRMHQLRIHMAHIGHPILGDTLYGKGRVEMSRLMLHAAGLNVRHPSGEALELVAELPADFVREVQALGLQSGL